MRLDADVCLWCYLAGAPRSRVSGEDLEFAREARRQGRDLERLEGRAAALGRRLRGVALDLELAAAPPATLRAEAGRVRAWAIEAVAA